MAERLTVIDDTNRDVHSKLVSTDQVFFWLEYTSGKRYDYGRGNQLISNLKKKPGIAGPYELQHKERAIRESAAMFSTAISQSWREGAIFVPIPPSKVAGHPNHDDRIERLCKLIQGVPAAHVQNLILQAQSIDVPAHEAQPGERPTVEGLLKIWTINEALAGQLVPPPEKIVILDDVLTAGVHYRAAHTLLSKRFPAARIVGMFVARRVFPDPLEGLELTPET